VPASVAYQTIRIMRQAQSIYAKKVKKTSKGKKKIQLFKLSLMKVKI